MNPFQDYSALASSFFSLTASAWCVDGGGFLLTQRRNLSRTQQNPSVPSSFPFQKSLCFTHLPRARLWCFPAPCSSFLRTFPRGLRFGVQVSSPRPASFLWWIHTNPTLELGCHQGWQREGELMSLWRGKPRKRVSKQAVWQT